MIDSNMINNYVLKPLMAKNKMASNSTELLTKRYTLEDTIYYSLIPQNNLHKEAEFSKLLSDVNSGNCVLFIDSLSQAFDIEVKGFKARAVAPPHNEVVVRGAQEAFVEAIRTNTSLLRRIINNENLIIESSEIGTITRTKIAICYLKNIANEDLIR